MWLEDDEYLYSGPDPDETEEFIDSMIQLADSYPHDDKWRGAVLTIGAYQAGYCTRTGAAA